VIAAEALRVLIAGAGRGPVSPRPARPPAPPCRSTDAGCCADGPPAALTGRRLRYRAAGAPGRAVGSQVPWATWGTNRSRPSAGRWTVHPVSAER
jgi:hypothetical protein